MKLTFKQFVGEQYTSFDIANHAIRDFIKNNPKNKNLFWVNKINEGSFEVKSNWTELTSP